MIPQFPQFKSVELSDRKAVEMHTGLYHPYSDFDFTCLWIWDTDKRRMLAQLHDNLVVKFTDYVTQEPFLSFLGTRDCEDTVRTLIEYCKKEGLSTTLRLVPDVSISKINPEIFTVEESRDDFDYIYSVEALAILQGKQFHSKRGRVNKFRHENADAKVEVLDLTSKEVQKNIIHLYETWEKNKIILKDEYVRTHEFDATERLLASDILDRLLAIGIFLNGDMIGYFIGEKVSPEYAIGRFSKFDVSCRGIYEVLVHEYAKCLHSFQIKYISLESDLGVESMRRSKTSWRPATFLKRYNVRYSHM